MFENKLSIFNILDRDRSFALSPVDIKMKGKRKSYYSLRTVNHKVDYHGQFVKDIDSEMYLS